MKYSTFNFLTLIVAVAAVAAVAADEDRSEIDIPGVAIRNGSFTTLVAALSATDLVGAISSPAGPFTVFAPTDDAFDALPNGLVECLLQDQNLPILSNILLYHVASGEVLSTDLMNGMKIPTLLEEVNVTVDLNNGNGVKINDSTVYDFDMLASNGVIHVLNQVLVPPSVDVGAFLQTCNNGGSSSSSSSSSNDTSSLVDIPTTAINAGIFSTLVAALSATDLVGPLSESNGPYTVFAPNDDAFNALPDGLVSCLLEDKNLPILSDILLYHGASGKVLSTDLSNKQKISTLLTGADVTVNLNNDVKINDSNVIGADVLASNGVIHIINAVLVPPRIDVGAFLKTCRGSGSHSVQPPSHNTNSLKTIEQFLMDSPNFTTLTAAIVQGDVVGVLDDPNLGLFTLFAPTDTAFEDVPTAVLNYLLDDANKATLAEVLSYHVTRGSIKANDIPERSMTNIETLADSRDSIAISKTCYSATAIEAGQEECGNNYSLLLDNNSDVIATDIQTSNGIIHVINKVLIPPSLRDAVAGIVN